MSHNHKYCHDAHGHIVTCPITLQPIRQGQDIVLNRQHYDVSAMKNWTRSQINRRTPATVPHSRRVMTVLEAKRVFRSNPAPLKKRDTSKLMNWQQHLMMQKNFNNHHSMISNHQRTYGPSVPHHQHASRFAHNASLYRVWDHRQGLDNKWGLWRTTRRFGSPYNYQRSDTH
jgi:hypothetical protein